MKLSIYRNIMKSYSVTLLLNRHSQEYAMTHPEKRTEMAGCHLTETEKRFLRIHAAGEGDTISTFIRKTLNDVLSKVEKDNNPFTEMKNNR